MAGFTNSFGGQHWGNAEHWDDAARALGYRVDSVPAIGAVAQTDAGRVGHVAWVSAIGPGTVTIEEYNHSLPGGYGTRTVPVGDFRYLHLDDVAPSPLVGSDRPVVSVPDRLGESWTARVDDGGTLRVAQPGPTGPRRGSARRLLPRRGAGADASTAAAVPGSRRPRATAASLAGTVRGARFALRPVGAAAPTSSPALALSRTGRPVLAAVSPDGTLATRRFTQQGRWSRPARVGRAGVVGDPHRARARRRRLRAAPGWWPSPRAARPTPSASSAAGWCGCPGPPASITSTPALTRGRRRHDAPAPGRRRRSARPSARCAAPLEPARRPRRRLVAVLLPGRRRGRRPARGRGRRPARHAAPAGRGRAASAHGWPRACGPPATRPGRPAS